MSHLCPFHVPLDERACRACTLSRPLLTSLPVYPSYALSQMPLGPLVCPLGPLLLAHPLYVPLLTPYTPPCTPLCTSQVLLPAPSRPLAHPLARSHLVPMCVPSYPLPTPQCPLKGLSVPPAQPHAPPDAGGAGAGTGGAEPGGGVTGALASCPQPRREGDSSAAGLHPPNQGLPGR